MSGRLIGEPIVTGPWDDGSTATYTPWTDGCAVGFKCEVNGVVSYIYLNPSSGGGSPDIFVYNGPGGCPGVGWTDGDSPECFVVPEGVGMTPVEVLASVKGEE